MKVLNEYIEFAIPENAIDHVRTMIWLATNENVNDDINKEILRKIDKKLKDKAYVDPENNMTFTNLRDLCKYYSEQFQEDAKNNAETMEEFPSDPEELTSYMANKFGIAY